MNIPKTCPVCFSKFEVAKTHKKRITCSKKCGREHARSQIKPQYRPEEVQSVIDVVHGDGKIQMDFSTFTGVKKKAKFSDKDFGEWWTQPYLVMKGHGHVKNAILAMNKAVAWTSTEFNDKISKIHNSQYILVEETFTNVKNKAWFFDKKSQDWFETRPTFVLEGHGNPRTRAERIGKTNTPHLQKLARERTKYIGTSGETITGLCNQFDVASSGYLKLAKEVSTDFAIKAFLSHIKDGKYVKYQSNLEVFFLDLFKTSFPQLEKWNKQPTEAPISYHPDFRFEKDGRVLYVDVHGLFFHSEFHVSPTHHQERAKAFEAAGIAYLQFFADEIFQKPQIVISMVLSRLGMSAQKFAARKLFLKKVLFKEAKKFFDDNHLMGYKPSRVIGLYDNKNNLISALSFRVNKNFTEIDRFCTKLDTSCSGGFSKLVSELKAFKKPITSFCDLRYSNGKSYLLSGFKDSGETLGWCWTTGSARFNRLACTATGTRTEKENAASRGWFKIFDAGQRKYVLNY